MGPSALFNPLASIVNILVRNSMAPVRIEAIACDIQIEPGQELKAFVTLKPFKGERETLELSLPIPSDFPEGTHEAVFCDAATSLEWLYRAGDEPYPVPALPGFRPARDRAPSHGP